MIPQSISDGLVTFALALVPALFGIICHEVAHGWAAYKMGDPTAKFLGRLTLNPVKHIDPMGLGMFAFTAMFAPFAIGWAKPVPIQPGYFRHPREGMVLVSVAGPLANILVALLCAFILKLTTNLGQSGIGADSVVLGVVAASAQLGVFINIALAWFNLIPVPPLDGSHILGGLLPEKLANSYASIGRYGMIVIILLLATGMVGRLLMPLVFTTRSILYSIVGL